MSREDVRSVGGHRISVSSGDRVMYPAADGEPPITKADVVDYYERIADVMLPHVRGRPASLQQWPQGIGGGSFYRKETPDYFPDWIETVEVDKEGGTNCQVVIDRAATLVYLAQQNTLTPHVWTSCVSTPRHPDRMVFDFDPSETPASAISSGGAPDAEAHLLADTFGAVRDAARDLRALLEEELGLSAWVMTSGSRGLHVHVPLDRSEDHDAVRAFARRVAEVMVARDPERLTVEHRKEKRAGRIFVDVLRNGYAQTAVAPWALRARPGAPVATPLDWDELGRSGMGPRRYGLRNVFRRLARKEDPWRDIDRHAAPLTAARGELERLGRPS